MSVQLERERIRESWLKRSCSAVRRSSVLFFLPPFSLRRWARAAEHSQAEGDEGESQRERWFIWIIRSLEDKKEW